MTIRELYVLLIVLTSSASTLSKQLGSTSQIFRPRGDTDYDTADSEDYESADESKFGNQGDLTKLGTFTTKPYDGYIDDNTPVGNTKHIGLESWKISAYDGVFTDPLWNKQWYEQDYRTEDGPVYDHNVVPVYRQGITGRGVTVAVVDTGVEYNHPDLVANYVKSLSYDAVHNSRTFRIAKIQGVRNSHGTICAGVIAMAANNSRCGVGIAFNAKITGITAVGDGYTDLHQARGLAHQLNKIDIYSNSWNSGGEGDELDESHHLILKAIAKGIETGRDGKGAIYIFASGNGAKYPFMDNCGSDGLVNSPFVIPIGAANQMGKETYYSESCPAVFATAYSAGTSEQEGVVTTEMKGKCTTQFIGTSAATAVASGILALVLEANSSLTYRDVMHLIVMGSEVAPLADNPPNWFTNGAGFLVSNLFGFGLLNAENMVDLARAWKGVPDKKVCVVWININKTIMFDGNGTHIFDFETEACQDTANGVFYLEHIELSSAIALLIKVDRGDMSISITSPENTKTILLDPRPMDKSRRGFRDWSITSKNTWGENPKGKWKIEVKVVDFDQTWPFLSSKKDIGRKRGFVRGFTLTLHGTKEKPKHYDEVTPYRQYAGFFTLNAAKYFV